MDQNNNGNNNSAQTPGVSSPTAGMPSSETQPVVSQPMTPAENTINVDPLTSSIPQATPDTSTRTPDPAPVVPVSDPVEPVIDPSLQTAEASMTPPSDPTQPTPALSVLQATP